MNGLEPSSIPAAICPNPDQNRFHAIFMSNWHRPALYFWIFVKFVTSDVLQEKKHYPVKSQGCVDYQRFT